MRNLLQILTQANGNNSQHETLYAQWGEKFGVNQEVMRQAIETILPAASLSLTQQTRQENGWPNWLTSLSSLPNPFLSPPPQKPSLMPDLSKSMGNEWQAITAAFFPVPGLSDAVTRYAAENTHIPLGVMQKMMPFILSLLMKGIIQEAKEKGILPPLMSENWEKGIWGRSTNQEGATFPFMPAFMRGSSPSPSPPPTTIGVQVGRMIDVMMGGSPPATALPSPAPVAPETSPVQTGLDLFNTMFETSQNLHSQQRRALETIFEQFMSKTDNMLRKGRRNMADKKIIIGTRGSPLALAQAAMVRAALENEAHIPPDQIQLEIITTLGDQQLDRPLAEIGGKGLFTKEIDQAELDGLVDIAVHSAKDLPTVLPKGLVIAGFLPREDVRDALIAPQFNTLQALPQGARIGTVSLRRQAFLKRLRPDFQVETLRGNVGTRLEKVQKGEFDAILLACAGLKRLGLAEVITDWLDANLFLPAVGQGAVALVIREGDEDSEEAIAPFLCQETAIAVVAERAFLFELDGSCRTPIAGYGKIVAGQLCFRGAVLRPDGQEMLEIAGQCAPNKQDAYALGQRLGATLKTRMPPDFF